MRYYATSCRSAWRSQLKFGWNHQQWQVKTSCASSISSHFNWPENKPLCVTMSDCTDRLWLKTNKSDWCAQIWRVVFWFSTFRTSCLHMQPSGASYRLCYTHTELWAWTAQARFTQSSWKLWSSLLSTCLSLSVSVCLLISSLSLAPSPAFYFFCLLPLPVSLSLILSLVPVSLPLPLTLHLYHSLSFSLPRSLALFHTLCLCSHDEMWSVPSCHFTVRVQSISLFSTLSS